MSDIELIQRNKSALKQQGVSLRELAAGLGKKETEISRWLSGCMGISEQNLQRIEEVLCRPLSRESLQKSGNRSIRVGIVGIGHSQLFCKRNRTRSRHFSAMQSLPTATRCQGRDWC